MSRGGVAFEHFEEIYHKSGEEEKKRGRVFGVWGTRAGRREEGEEGEEGEEEWVEERGGEKGKDLEEEEEEKERDPLLSSTQLQQPQDQNKYKTIFPYPGYMVSIAGEEVWCPMGDGFVVISANFLERSLDIQGFIDRNISYDVLVFHIAVIVIDVEKLRGERGEVGGEWDGWERGRRGDGEDEGDIGERGNMEVWASDTGGNIVIYDVERREILGLVRREWGMCLISHMALVGDEV